MNIQQADALMRSLGEQVYRVGGSVRDELIGRRVKDADYLVHGIELGDLKHKLSTVASGRVTPLKLRNGAHVGWRFDGIEVVIPRKEFSTGPGRHDFKMVTDPYLSLWEDAYRRDFTFNALYRELTTGEVLDPTLRGKHDLERRLVVTTHPSSFRDDPLRMLRALRFVSTLEFDLGQTAHLDMAHHADAMTGLTQKGVSGTAFEELCKLLMGANAARALRYMRDTGVLAIFLPELKPMLGFEQCSRYHDLTTDEHTFKALETAAAVSAPLRVRMALLFHDAGKPESAWVGDDGRNHYYSNGETQDHELVGDRLWREAANRLNVPKRLRTDVSTLILNHMLGIGGKFKPQKVRRMRVQLGDEMLKDLILHRACDVLAKEKIATSAAARLAEMELERERAQREGIPASIRDLQINGQDCIAAGLTGKSIGATLAEILDDVVCNPTPTLLSREWQLSRLCQ